MNSFEQRIDFGAPFEPSGRVLHGAGQDFHTWKNYRALSREHGAGTPDCFMAYTGVRGAASRRKRLVEPYLEEFSGEDLILQLGLSMTQDGKPENCYAHDVAAGAFDADIEYLAEYLAQCGIPSLIRIGYECSSPWNGYESGSFVQAFRRIVETFRKRGVPFAPVWCVEGGWTQASQVYYPGDDYVDWISVDLFAVEHFEMTQEFMEISRQREKPVLIGECTPRRVGVNEGELSWKTWYAPFFEWIGSHPNVKGFSYINWDWSGHPQWEDWGDARVGENTVVCSRWFEAVRRIALP